jgi:biotin carboxyl carrier protein
MKLRVTIDSEENHLDFQRNAGETIYRLEGAINREGSASVAEIVPGVFSILLGQHSYTVQVVPGGDELEVWTQDQRYSIAAADLRDRSAKLKKQSLAGPMELRAQMPGKIVKLLVAPGAQVRVGQSLIVVEAMKMQNEMKSPKDGLVQKIHAIEGATVVAGEPLMMVD